MGVCAATADYIRTLSSRPSMVLVEALTQPPDNACMTTIEVSTQ